VRADELGPDGKLVGWEVLDRIFSQAAPGFVIGPQKQLFKQKVGKGLPHWCGIFAVWASQAARGTENVGTWPIGGPLDHVPGFRRLGKGERPQRGDVGWKPTERDPVAGHFVVVREVIGSADSDEFSVKAVEGNSGDHSEIRAPDQAQSGSVFRIWYSLFVGQDQASARTALEGKWTVRVGWKPWHYQFKGAEQVTYADPQDSKTVLGTGSWRILGHKLKIQWNDLDSWEEWDLPVARKNQVGGWRSKKTGGRTDRIEANKL